MNNFDPLLIRASAGTGKTFQLSNRYIALLAAGAPPEEILATTFTRKAAHEILERIFKRLADAAASESVASELAKAIQVEALNSQQARKILLDLLQRQHRLRISTLDSFFIGLTRAFAFEVGLDKNWRILDEASGEDLRSQSVQYLCENLESGEILQLLRLVSKKGVRRAVHKSFSGLVENLYELFRESAVENWSWLTPQQPTSGKSKNDIAAHLLEVEVPKTKKGEPDKRWTKAVEQTRDLLLKEDWEAIVEKGLCNAVLLGKNEYFKTEITGELYSLCSALVEHARFELLSALRNQSLALYHILSLYHEAFASRQKKSGGLRFSDVKYILKNAAFTGALEDIFYRLDSRISHLLLDEFQDTSLEEWTILEPYVAEILSKAKLEHTFFCVGDVKQSIYGWRGGVAEIFDTLESRWSNLIPQSMDTSYRSAPQIMTAVNTLFQSILESPHLPTQVKEKWLRYFNDHQTARSDIQGYVALKEIEEYEDEEGNPSSYLETVKKVKELYLQQKDISIGVLVRRNLDISRLIYLLSREEIPASEEGGNPLTDSQAVLVILNLLRVLDHPGDNIAYFHLSHSRLGKSIGLDQPLSEREMMKRLDVLRSEVFLTGYGPFLRSITRGIIPSLPPQDRRRVLQLVELGFAFDEIPSDRISSFVRYVERTRVEDPESQHIRVMTVHKSKGLEFDVVFLPGLNRIIRPLYQTVLVHREDPVSPPEKIIPYPKEIIRELNTDLARMKETERTKNFQEELCVLYVALTRAKKALYMYVPDEETLKAPSPASFLREAFCQGTLHGKSKVLYEDGDEAAALSCDESMGIFKSAETKIVQLPEKIQVLDSNERTRMLSRKTPSKLEGGGIVQLKDLFQESRNASAVRGTVIHFLFEQIEWYEEYNFGEDALQRMMSELNLTSVGDAKTYLSEFMSMIEQPQIRELLKKCRYAEEAANATVRCEFPFLYREGDALVKGIIDRFVYLEEGGNITGAEIIDYKTDSTGDISERVEFYRPQLEAYREAISRSVRIEKEAIRLTLAFVTHGQVVNVS